MVKTLALTLLAASAVSADVVLQPTRLALFKNGYGFVTLRGQLDEAASTRLGPLPVPSAGTFWVGVGEGAQLKSLVSGLRDFPAESAASVDMGSLAFANPGKKVSLTYENGSDDVGYATGTLLAMPAQQELQPGNVIGGIWKPSPAPVHCQLVMLRKDDGSSVIIPARSLRSLTFEGDFTMPVETERRPAVDLELAAPAPGAAVEVTSLSAGITWQPSYRFELGDGGKGVFSAKATITNNLMDIAHAEVELITGYPSLERAEEVDPIALQGASGRQPRPMMAKGDVRTTQAVMMNAAAPMADGFAEEAVSYDAGAVADGVQNSDLFFYPLADFSAKAGEVVMRPLFSTPVDYRSVYVWEVGDPRNFTTPVPGEVQQLTEVWHCIRFMNPLKMPLTTAAVEFLQQGRIAGTNTISYTPANRECTTRMNKAVNVPVHKESRLVTQQRTSLPNHGSVMDNTSAVTLGVSNGTAEAIDVEIMQRLNGTVTEPGTGEVTVTGAFSGPAGSNPATIIRWKLHLEPGQTEKVTYTYKFYR